MPFEAEIEITALGLAGDGIGHLEGGAVFVPYAAPGDRLLVRLEDDGEGGWRIDGGFRLERVLPIDQFPWSAHLELVGVFRR